MKGITGRYSSGEASSLFIREIVWFPSVVLGLTEIRNVKLKSLKSRKVIISGSKTNPLSVEVGYKLSPFALLSSFIVKLYEIPYCRTEGPITSIL